MPINVPFLKAVSELLTVVQANPMLLVVLVTMAALLVVALALKVVHAAVGKK